MLPEQLHGKDTDKIKIMCSRNLVGHTQDNITT